VDLAAQWKPTVEWLATLPKATVLELARDAGADKLALAALGTQPKAKLPEAALPLFPAGWLPKPLRPAAKPAKKARRAS